MAWINLAFWDHQMQNFFYGGKEATPLRNTQKSYTFRLKKGLIFGIFSSSIVEFSCARGRATPNHTYTLSMLRLK